MSGVVERLLASDPWVAYRTHIDLLGADGNQPYMKDLYKAMVDHPKVQSLLEELRTWPGHAVKRHNDATLHLHKLAFLADLGICGDHIVISEVCQKIIADADPNGPFRIVVNLPVPFGGSGKDELSWMLCDSPLQAYALIRFGYQDVPQVNQALDYYASLVRENGWPCAADDQFGKKFKGPGRKEDPCPYANLLMIKLLTVFDPKSELLSTGIKAALDLWDIRKSKKPFLFAMGTDFAKLKAPFIWYDLLHLLDVLSLIPEVFKDERMTELLDLLESQKRTDGMFMAGSVWRAWKEWDFGQKREPSDWITFLAYRILARSKRFNIMGTITER